MEQKDGMRVCRTCLKTISSNEKMLSIYKICDFLKSYTCLKIVENDGLPTTICINCNKRANQAYKFKLLCEQSDHKLRTSFNISKQTTVNTVWMKEQKAENSDNSENDLQSEQFSSIPIEENKSFIKKEDIESDTDIKNEEAVFCAEENRVPINIAKCDNVKRNARCVLVVDNVVNKNFKCRFCDLTFMNKTRLLKHEIKHENGIKCYICGKNYQTVKQLSSHISIHNRKGAHFCETCGKQFTMPENLVRHQRIHSGIRPYKCNVCEKSFTQSSELKSHLITHTAEKTHLCYICGNKYARKMSLQVHMRRLHSDSSIMRPFQCDTCGRSFKDKRDLSQHTSIHKGERKHVCKVCNKAFNRSSNLKVHERIHSGYRPYVCHICQKAFIQKHVLNTHLRTHPNT